MLKGLDSASPPSDSQIQQALKDGVKLWSGYIPGPYIDKVSNPWEKADFQRVLNAGMNAIGYASGYSDPGYVAQTAHDWGILAALDMEYGIRTKGSWTQPWLDKAGAGLYAHPQDHSGLTAVFHVAADYPGYNPKKTWPGGYPRPDTPCGWQWHGTHTEYGVSVDSSWFDDWFGDSMDQATFDKMLKQGLKDLLAIDADNQKSWGQGTMGLIDNAGVKGKDGQAARDGVKTYLTGLGDSTSNPTGVPAHTHDTPAGKTGGVTA